MWVKYDQRESFEKKLMQRDGYKQQFISFQNMFFHGKHITMSFPSGYSLQLIVVMQATLFPITNMLENIECLIPIRRFVTPKHSCNLSLVFNFVTKFQLNWILTMSVVFKDWYCIARKQVGLSCKNGSSGWERVNYLR